MKNLGLRLLLTVMVLASRAGAGEWNHVLVLKMRDAKGRVDAQQLQDSVDWAVRELHLQGQPLPLIVVFHISSAAAQRLGVETHLCGRTGETAGVMNYGSVGEQSNEICSQMTVGILEHHFALRLDATRRAQAMQSVRSHLDSTVSATRWLSCTSAPTQKEDRNYERNARNELCTQPDRGSPVGRARGHPPQIGSAIPDD